MKLILEYFKKDVNNNLCCYYRLFGEGDVYKTIKWGDKYKLVNDKWKKIENFKEIKLDINNLYDGIKFTNKFIPIRYDNKQIYLSNKDKININNKEYIFFSGLKKNGVNIIGEINFDKGFTPVVKTPSPVVKIPSPVAKTPSPVVKIPSPVAKTPVSKFNKNMLFIGIGVIIIIIIAVILVNRR